MRRLLAAAAVAAFFVCVSFAAAQQPQFLNKQYSDTVHQLRSCFGVLSPTDRRIVVLRSGIGPRDPASPQQIAAELKISAASVAKAQWVPVRKMRAAQQAGQCGAAQAP